MANYGFAPHIVREDRTFVEILSEDYDPLGGYYKIIFRPQPSDSATSNINVTRIRFWGGGFKGRFEIMVLRALTWHVDYDIPPLGTKQSNEKMLRDEQGELAEGEGELYCQLPFETQNGRPRFRQSFSSTFIPTMNTPLEEIEKNLEESPTATEDALPPDPSQYPGARGGCTLTVQHVKENSRFPVIEVRISKRAERTQLAGAQLRAMGSAFGHAHSAERRRSIDSKRFSFDALGVPNDDVHLANQHRALEGLEGAKEALRALQLGGL